MTCETPIDDAELQTRVSALYLEKGRLLTGGDSQSPPAKDHGCTTCLLDGSFVLW